MSQETTKPSTVELVTAAYLNESYSSEVPLPSDPPTVVQDPTVTALMRFTRAISAIFVGLLIVAIPINVMTVWSAEKDRRTCGVDWILWMVGSDKTFQGTLLESLEKSREDFERRMEESKPQLEHFDIKEFDVDQLHLSPSWTPNRE